MFQISKKLRLGVISLGCPKNTVDTECMISALGISSVTSDPSAADVILVNTCAFLKDARKESENAIEDMLKTGKKIIVAGCYVSKGLKGLKKKYPGVHAWVGINDIKSVKKALLRGGEHNSSPPCIYTHKQHTVVINPYSVYVKVSEGCNHRCSFCIIPSIKGRYRSRRIPDIIKEVNALVLSGAKEINIISQDPGYYGVDIYGKKELGRLVKKILKTVKRNFMLRVLYLYPCPETIKKLVEIMKKDRRLCRYLDVPLQHVSNSVLSAMKRGYRENDIKAIISCVRNSGIEITLRSSFIAGFPGETEEDFRKMLDFIKSGSIDKAGIFSYSDEPDAASYKIKNKNSERQIKSRYERLTLASGRVCYYNNVKKKGTAVKALVAGRVNAGLYAARGEESAPDIDGYIFIKTKKKLTPGQFVKVRITGASGADMAGSLLQGAPRAAFRK